MTHTIRKDTPFIIKFIKIILLAVIAAIFIKAFIVDAFTIPTGSMENTLLVGDFIIVNKLAYAVSTPRNIPVINTYVKSYRLIDISRPERNDVIVFEFPGNKNEYEPVPRVNYIKRVIGLPGDTVQVKKQAVYVNNVLFDDPETVKNNKIKQRKGDKDPGMFFPEKEWNRDNYGPVIVPKKGMSILLDRKNIGTWGMMINREFGKKAVSVEGTVITIEDKPVREYTFTKDYYFVLGDNRDDSMDSRYWGFVPEDYIIGKALLVYWSVNPSSEKFDFLNLSRSLRTGRFFKLIH